MSKNTVDDVAEQEERSGFFATLRATALIGVFIAIIFAISSSMPKTQTNLNEVWDERTTIGNLDAKNHFVMTTDIMCPYCAYFSRAIMSEQEEFEKYIEENDILYEMRITDFLREYGYNELVNSTYAAEATLCATEEDRFWDYYHQAMTSLDEDYHSKGIGNSKTAPKIEGMTEEYWLKIGEKIGLGEKFNNCFNGHEMLGKVQENTLNTAKIMDKTGFNGGMPYFRFNNFETSGFDTSWGWDYVKEYFKAGLDS